MKRSAGVVLPISFGWHGTDGGTPPKPRRHEPKVTALIPRSFMRGLITNLLNPKAVVFYIAVLPTFVDAAGSVLGQTVILSVVYVVIATALHSAIVSLAGAARPFLEDPDRSRIVRRTLSIAPAMIAIWFAFSTALKQN